jgi:hypothetical protein
MGESVTEAAAAGADGPANNNTKVEITSESTLTLSHGTGTESEKELEEIVAKRAGNSEDRYKILEARDKIFRISELL